MGILSHTAPKRDGWVGTRWSVIKDLDHRGSREWNDCWTHFMDAYRAPMRRYVKGVLARLRGRPTSEDEAEDVVQSFLVASVEKGWLSRADQQVGPFRAFLQILLRRHVYRLARHASAKGRSPEEGRVVYSLRHEEASDAKPPDDRLDIDAFNKSWVETAVERALDRLSREHGRYRVVVEDLIRTDGEGSPDLHERVGLHKQQLPVLKNRARKRFCRIFEDELAETVGDQESFEEEWRAIRPFLPKGL